MYDPAIGRFTGVNALAEERIWLYTYDYTQNNPLVRVDPDGNLDDYYLDEEGNVIDHVENDQPDRHFVEDKDGKKEHNGRTFKQVLIPADQYDYNLNEIPRKREEDLDYVQSEFAYGNMLSRAKEVIERDLNTPENQETVEDVKELLGNVFGGKRQRGNNDTPSKSLCAKKKDVFVGGKRINKRVFPREIKPSIA